MSRGTGPEHAGTHADVVSGARARKAGFKA